jgi:hypothetical protein
MVGTSVTAVWGLILALFAATIWLSSLMSHQLYSTLDSSGQGEVFSHWLLCVSMLKLYQMAEKP